MPRLSARRPSKRFAFAQRRFRARVLGTDKKLEQRYVNVLQGVVGALHDEMVETIEPKLAKYVHTDARADASNPFSAEIDSITLKHVASAPRTVSPYFTRHAKEVADDNAKALRVVGIKPNDLRLGPVISTARDQSIQLVEKAMRAYAQDVRDIFDDPNTFGLRVDEIKAKLVERGNVSDSRAALIARDQTLKLNGAITKTRQENAGVTRYVWSTSLDERVRPEHAALEGQTFDWNAPPPPGHPGEDFQCRCVAVPVIDGLDDITDFPQVPEEEEAAPIEAAPLPPPKEPDRLRVGEQFLDFDSELSASATRDILGSISDRPTLDFLSREPLQKLSIQKSTDIDGKPTNGWYDRKTGELALTGKRVDTTFGQKFVAGKSWSMSATESDAREATKTTLLHELGHHVHLAGDLRPSDAIVRDAFDRAAKSNTFITQYAGSSRYEYFAESWTAFHKRPDALKNHDPNGYAMVEAVLRERGIR